MLPTGHGPRERHWRMARNRELDVCEFKVGACLMARDHGEPLTAIPLFLHPRFRQGFAFVHVDAGIKTPRDPIGSAHRRHQLSTRGNPRRLFSTRVSDGYRRFFSFSMRSSRGGCVMKRRSRPPLAPPDMPKARI
jgi:hypothetical protein